MSQPYLGEIRPVPYNFAPLGWAFCDGRLLSIEQNQALFALLGTTYGGDGQSTFALPDLRGRVPVGSGSNGQNNYVTGQVGGVESVALISGQLPSHNHLIGASNQPASSVDPTGNCPAVTVRQVYGPPVNGQALAADTIQTVGANQAHGNMQPFTCISFIIALAGIFPTQG